MKHCYLIATIDPKYLQVLGVGAYSDPPWNLTRQLGPNRPIMAIVSQTEGDTYEEALESMERIYPVYESALAARFPLPLRKRGDGESAVATCVMTTKPEST